MPFPRQAPRSRPSGAAASRRSAAGTSASAAPPASPAATASRRCRRGRHPRGLLRRLVEGLPRVVGKRAHRLVAHGVDHLLHEGEEPLDDGVGGARCARHGAASPCRTACRARRTLCSSVSRSSSACTASLVRSSLSRSTSARALAPVTARPLDHGIGQRLARRLRQALELVDGPVGKRCVAHGRLLTAGLGPRASRAGYRPA